MTVSSPVLLESQERDPRSVPYETAHSIRIPRASFRRPFNTSASFPLFHARCKKGPLSLVNVIPGSNNGLRDVVNCARGSSLAYTLFSIGSLHYVQDRLSSNEASAVSVPLRDVAFGNRDCYRCSRPGFCHWITRVLQGAWNGRDFRRRPIGHDMPSRVVDYNALEIDPIAGRRVCVFILR